MDLQLPQLHVIIQAEHIENSFNKGLVITMATTATGFKNE